MINGLGKLLSSDRGLRCIDIVKGLESQVDATASLGGLHENKNKDNIKKTFKNSSN